MVAPTRSRYCLLLAKYNAPDTHRLSPGAATIIVPTPGRVIPHSTLLCVSSLCLYCTYVSVRNPSERRHLFSLLPHESIESSSISICHKTALDRLPLVAFDHHNTLTFPPPVIYSSSFTAAFLLLPATMPPSSPSASSHSSGSSDSALRESHQ